MANDYNIDRKTASRLLNVSLRTVDRYLSTGRLSSIKSNGRVWLSHENILSILKQMEADMVDMSTHVSWQHDSAAKTVDSDADIPLESEIVDDTVSSERQSRNPYKQLYEETKVVLEEKQKLLDQATYRVGQLEAQITAMVPLVEFKQQQKLLAATTDEYEKAVREEEIKRERLAAKLLEQIDVREKTMIELDRELDAERLNKAVFAVILFMVLALQPVLWVLLR